MTWPRRVAFACAVLGAIFTLVTALAGGFFMALGNADDSGGNPAPPMPWPQAAFFPLLLVAAALAIAFAVVMRRHPRLGAMLGLLAVALGAAATAYCVYDVRFGLAVWFVATAPVTVAALMCVPSFRAPRNQGTMPLDGEGNLERHV